MKDVSDIRDDLSIVLEAYSAIVPMLSDRNQAALLKVVNDSLKRTINDLEQVSGGSSGGFSGLRLVK